MNDAILTAIATEIKAEMQLAPSTSDEVLKQYTKEGEAFLNSRLSGLEIDFNADLVARALLKNYVRYAYYGMVSDFKEKYNGDIYDTISEYIS